MGEAEHGGTIIFDPGREFHEEALFWEGCPTILRTPKGKFFAGWYGGGTREPSQYNCNILRSSTDGGKHWGEAELVIASVPEEKSRAIDVQLWLDPKNRMWLFWTQRNDNFPAHTAEHLHTWAIVCDDPDAPTLHWSEPQLCADGFVRCQPTVLSNGHWILCAYDWRGERYHYAESDDEGASWMRREGGRKLPTHFDESMVLEQKIPGRLTMFARTNCGTFALSKSENYGTSWTPACKGNLAAADGRLFVRRLRSGRVLLVFNHHVIKHRRNMTAMLSEDDGITFPYKLLLDGRDCVSYPDAVEAPDGKITVIYDFQRFPNGEILLTHFREEDVLAGKFISADAVPSFVISQARNFDEAARAQCRDEELRYPFARA